jgi:hypothetical protein
MATNLNISTVISPDVLKTISASTLIKTFGDQLKDKAKDKIVVAATSKVNQLEVDIESLIRKQQEIKKKHTDELKRIDILYQTGEINIAEAEVLTIKENEAYDKQQKLIQVEIDILKKDIIDIVRDPYNDVKKQKKKLNEDIKKFKADLKKQSFKSTKDEIKKILKNNKKTLASIIGLSIAGKLATIVSQRTELEDLVDKTNIIIDQANTPETITVAINLRNNVVALINNSIRKLENLQSLLGTISIVLTVSSTLLNVLGLTTPLTAISTLPGTPVIMGIHDRLRDKIIALDKLITSLSAVLAIATVLLENEIIALNELIDRLRQISSLLDGKTLTDLNSQQLTDLTRTLLTDTQFPPYKGFNFKIKEEQNQAFVVKGNKRHYAVAIDRDGVEVLKSDYSFTLDPNDLVEQLKLVIDQKNLQG